MMFPRENVLGVGVSAINLDLAVNVIDNWIANNQREYVCVLDVHAVMEGLRDEAVRVIHNEAGLATPDGMPLVWLLRMAGFRESDRVYGPDLMIAVMKHLRTKDRTHYLYGGSENTLSRLRSNLECYIPGVRIVGGMSPPFRRLSPVEDRIIVETLNSETPDVIWISLGSPKQERWMAEHRALLNARVLIGVGAAFDFHAGTVRQAPRWVQRSGFEWLFRLCIEPRRLWKRYLINNSWFVASIMAQKIGFKRYSMDQ